MQLMSYGVCHADHLCATLVLHLQDVGAVVKLNASRILTLLKGVAQKAVPIRHNPDNSSTSTVSIEHSGLIGLLQLPPGDLGYAKLLLTSLEHKLTCCDQVSFGERWRQFGLCEAKPKGALTA